MIIYLISQRGSNGLFNKLSKVVSVKRYGCWEQIFEDLEEAEDALNGFDEGVRPFYSIFEAEIDVRPYPLKGKSESKN